VAAPLVGPDARAVARDGRAGRAFCYLPLPVSTAMPVHINGYFELSSNRRDIWHGEDMAGEGRLRSEWNALLLHDVASLAYAQVEPREGEPLEGAARESR
jgi:hypothetical protein